MSLTREQQIELMRTTPERHAAIGERTIAAFRAHMNERYPVIGTGRLVPIEEPEG